MSVPPAPSEAIHTEFSATFFSGSPSEWVRYLSLSPEVRYEPDIEATLRCERADWCLRFEPKGETAHWLCELLAKGMSQLRAQVRHKPAVEAELEWVLFERASMLPVPYQVHLSRLLPAVSTREVGWDVVSPRVRLVFNRGLALTVRQALDSSELSKQMRLGISWPRGP